MFSAPRMVSSSLLPSAAAAAVASPNVVPPSKRREVSSDTFVDQIYLSLMSGQIKQYYAGLPDGKI